MFGSEELFGKHRNWVSHGLPTQRCRRQQKGFPWILSTHFPLRCNSFLHSPTPPSLEQETHIQPRPQPPMHSYPLWLHGYWAREMRERRAPSPFPSPTSECSPKHLSARSVPPESGRAPQGQRKETSGHNDFTSAPHMHTMKERTLRAVRAHVISSNRGS